MGQLFYCFDITFVADKIVIKSIKLTFENIQSCIK